MIVNDFGIVSVIGNVVFDRVIGFDSGCVNESVIFDAHHGCLMEDVHVEHSQRGFL